MILVIEIHEPIRRIVSVPNGFKDVFCKIDTHLIASPNWRFTECAKSISYCLFHFSFKFYLYPISVAVKCCKNMHALEIIIVLGL